MNKRLLDDLLYCLSEDKVVVHYFKDKYCLFLLQQCIKQKTKIQALKQGPMAHLLQKPVIKKWLANFGNQQVSPWMIDQLWEQDLYHFTLTLGSWGGQSHSWQQTCRKGYNLVLQLNFSSQHDRYLRHLSLSQGNQFKCANHPIHEYKQTMAWVRLDVADDLSEVLIEEVQNDWLRRAIYWHRLLSDPEKQDQAQSYGFVNWQKLDQYVQQFIAPLLPIWYEAMLCVTLEFINNTLGAKRIYMYEHETGCILKQIGRYAQPPKSLYTKLPKQFGFKLTGQMPNFLRSEPFVMKKIKQHDKLGKTLWHFLNLNMEEMKYA